MSLTEKQINDCRFKDCVELFKTMRNLFKELLDNIKKLEGRLYALEGKLKDKSNVDNAGTTKKTR